MAEKGNEVKLESFSLLRIVLPIILLAFASIAQSMPVTASIYSSDGNVIGSGVLVDSNIGCVLITAGHVSNSSDVEFKSGRLQMLSQADLKWTGTEVGIDISIYRSRQDVCESENITNPSGIRRALEASNIYILTRSPLGGNSFKSLILLEDRGLELSFGIADRGSLMEGSSGSPVFASGVLIGIYVGVTGDGVQKVVRLDELIKSDANLGRMLLKHTKNSPEDVQRVLGRVYTFPSDSFASRDSKQMTITGFELFDLIYGILPPMSSRSSESIRTGYGIDAFWGLFKDAVDSKVGKGFSLPNVFKGDFVKFISELTRLGLCDEFRSNDKDLIWTQSEKGVLLTRKLEDLRISDSQVLRREVSLLRSRNVELERELSSLKGRRNKDGGSKIEFTLQKGRAIDLHLIPGELVSFTESSSGHVRGLVAGENYNLSAGAGFDFRSGGSQYRLILLRHGYVDAEFRLERRQ
jgi:hypothetical protein